MRLPSRSEKLNYILLIALCVSSAVAAAPASIETRVEQAAREHVLEHARSAGLLNPSVELKVMARDAANACAEDVVVEALDTRHLTRMRFATMCNAAPSWRAEFVVRAALTADVVVAATDVMAGRPIEASQVALERRDATAGDALSDLQQAVGKSSRRALRSGQVVSSRWLIEPVLVKRGATVSIIARNSGVEVQVAGEAQEAGSRGEVVPVRNKTNGRIIRARVVGENAVEPVDISIPSAPSSPP